MFIGLMMSASIAAILMRTPPPRVVLLVLILDASLLKCPMALKVTAKFSALLDLLVVFAAYILATA